MNKHWQKAMRSARRMSTSSRPKQTVRAWARSVNRALTGKREVK